MMDLMFDWNISFVFDSWGDINVIVLLLFCSDDLICERKKDRRQRNEKYVMVLWFVPGLTYFLHSVSVCTPGTFQQKGHVLRTACTKMYTTFKLFEKFIMMHTKKRHKQNHKTDRRIKA